MQEVAITTLSHGLNRQEIELVHVGRGFILTPQQIKLHRQWSSQGGTQERCLLEYGAHKLQSMPSTNRRNRSSTSVCEYIVETGNVAMRENFSAHPSVPYVKEVPFTPLFAPPLHRRRRVLMVTGTLIMFSWKLRTSLCCEHVCQQLPEASKSCRTICIRCRAR